MITVFITQDLDSWVNGLILRIRRKRYVWEGNEFIWGCLSERICHPVGCICCSTWVSELDVVVGHQHVDGKYK